MARQLPPVAAWMVEISAFISQLSARMSCRGANASNGGPYVLVVAPVAGQSSRVDMLMSRVAPHMSRVAVWMSLVGGVIFRVGAWISLVASRMSRNLRTFKHQP